MSHQWSVFTKPWKEMPLEALADYVASLGFDGIELPVRPGFQIEPDRAEREMPLFARMLSARGLKLMSVASNTSEQIFAACQASGVRILRIMIKADPSIGWMRSMEDWRRRLDALQPLCERYGVTVGIQQHYGFGIYNTMEMRWLLEGLDSRYIGAIWDAAHSALSGEIPEQAIDIIFDKLVMVNLKTAYYARSASGEGDRFLPVFCTEPYGARPWAEAAAALQRRDYRGPICMPAEYTDETNLEAKIRSDFKIAKALFDCVSI